MKNCPLKIENIGEDIYTLMSRGHHDIHEFMRAVRRDGYDWQLGIPSHTWFHAVPHAEGGCIYHESISGARGAFPVTVAYESCHEESYEILAAAEGHV